MDREMGLGYTVEGPGIGGEELKWDAQASGSALTGDCGHGVLHV